MQLEQLTAGRARLLSILRAALPVVILLCALQQVLDIVPGEVGKAIGGGLGTLAFTLAAAIALLRAAWFERGRSVAWAIGAGIALWTPAYVYYVFDAQPWSDAPQASDVLWLTGYLGYYTAIIILAKTRVVRSAGVWLDGLAGSLALAALGLAVLVPLVRHSVSDSFSAVAVALAYPMADAVLLSFLLVVAAMTNWRPGRAMAILFAALGLLLAADLPYFFGTAAGTYQVGGFTDIAWMIATAAMATATWQPESRQGPASVRPGLALSFSSVSMLLSVWVLVYAAMGDVTVPAVVLAALAIGSAVMRLLVSYRELHELVESRRLSMTDDLTGLGNRRRMMQDLEPALQPGSEQNMAVVLLDLDGFKELNDALGHHAGDAVLRGIASRLASGLRDGDLAARLGGDEFAVLLADAGRDRAMAVAEPIVVDGVTLRTRASLGVVTCPEDGNTAELLLRRADLAMYRAKAQPDAVASYAAGLDVGALDRLRLAGDLERAIECRELVLYYQPIADVISGQIASVEALVRWEHPERGVLGPDAFLPALERTTLTHDFSIFVLETAIAETVAFRAAGRPLRVAANLMPADVLDSSLPSEIARLLLVHGAEPSDLVVEVTETGVLSDFDRAHDVIQSIRALGVHVALDDFGTGHSSLTHLQRLPVDVLKIDRSFVINVPTEPATAAIVRSMIELAHTLGQRVVAEGVEDVDLWNRLRQWNCDFAQGYIVGRAVSSAELMASLPELDRRARVAAGRPPLHVVA